MKLSGAREAGRGDEGVLMFSEASTVNDCLPKKTRRAQIWSYSHCSGLAGWQAHTAHTFSAVGGKSLLCSRRAWSSLLLTLSHLCAGGCCVWPAPTAPKMLGQRNLACTSCFCRYRVAVGVGPHGPSIPPSPGWTCSLQP